MIECILIITCDECGLKTKPVNIGAKHTDRLQAMRSYRDAGWVRRCGRGFGLVYRDFCSTCAAEMKAGKESTTHINV